MNFKNGYSHIIKSSKQKCKPAPWWPTMEQYYIAKEKAYPMMILESGQVTRVRADNLRRI